MTFEFQSAETATGSYAHCERVTHSPLRVEARDFKGEVVIRCARRYSVLPGEIKIGKDFRISIATTSGPQIDSFFEHFLHCNPSILGVRLGASNLGSSESFLAIFDSFPRTKIAENWTFLSKCL